MSMMKEKTIHELAKEHPDKSYRDLERYRDADRMEEAQRIPVTESRQKQADLEPIEGEEERLQKELGACITAGMKRDRDATELQQRKKSKIEELEEALANALAVNESHQKLNGKLQERLTELEEENKKLHNHLNKKINNVRKSGM
jgi:chromosome segregation ATPase